MSLTNDDNPYCGHDLVPGDHVTHVCYRCILCGATSGCSESLEQAALEPPREEFVIMSASMDLPSLDDEVDDSNIPF